ncbi:MAG: hemerythrin domain-containing protein [Myxococcales bacterium]|nr:hemerythrin domain-containing protein [Myxococcales bacterium]
MNAIELLETQHRDVDELFDRLMRGGGSDKIRQKLFDDLADMLAVHASIEELHFYPAVKGASSEENVEHSLEEHVGVKRKLSMCMATNVSGDKFLERLGELMEEVQHHVKEERTELFPKVRRMFDGDQLEALGQEMTSTMAELQKGHPRRDVPLQTMAPMPSTQLPTQGAISSRVMPHIGRALALPLQMLGVAQQVGKMAAKAKEAATGFAHGVQRGLARGKKREA